MLCRSCGQPSTEVTLNNNQGCCGKASCDEERQQQCARIEMDLRTKALKSEANAVAAAAESACRAADPSLNAVQHLEMNGQPTTSGKSKTAPAKPQIPGLPPPPPEKPSKSSRKNARRRMLSVVVIPPGSSLGSGTSSQRFTMTCGAKSGVDSKSIVDETPASKKKASFQGQLHMPRRACWMPIIF